MCVLYSVVILGAILRMGKRCILCKKRLPLRGCFVRKRLRRFGA